MIRMFQISNAEQAKSYYKTALSKADYYIEGQEHDGIYHGKIAYRLDLENRIVRQSAFDLLCDNINPNTGENLTPRTVGNRRVGYDTSFHCPKSVSILHALGNDDRIMKAFTESTYETMCEMQEDVQTRVRSQGQYYDRDTGEMLWMSFVHETARPVFGCVPDMHLHQHNLLMNVTWDETEQRFKAGQFHDIKQDMPYYQARFLKRLADKLQSNGYGIRKTQSGFEVTTIPQKAIDFFSKRTNHIGQVAIEKEIYDPKELDALGARTRIAKDKSLTMPELKTAWRKDMKQEGIDKTLKEETTTFRENITPEKIVDHTLDHSYARASVRRERQLQAVSYLHAIDDSSISMDDLDDALKNDERIFKIEDGKQTLCTTALVHEEEKEMVMQAISGRGKLRPLVSKDYKIDNDQLSDDQKKAVHHVLKSSDRLTMIRGGAGTGKTTLIKSAVEEIEKTGKEIFLFAPTSDASRNTLRNEGFENADTVAKLLKDDDLHGQMRNQVIWVDESGMLGTKDMNDIQNLSKDLNARLVLSGDPRQHTAVDRGDAMTILQKVAKTPYVSLETIYRQKVEDYKQSVEAISKGKVKDGFDKLNNMGSIKEFDKASEINDELLKDYLEGINDKKEMLVISPTNEQALSTTKSIREALKEKGVLNKRDKEFTVNRNFHFTEAQKKDERTYRKGQVLQLHQNVMGAKRGSKLDVVEAKDNYVLGTTKLGKPVAVSLDRAKDFDVYKPETRNLTKGDQIRITKNSSDSEGKRLDNGWMLQVDGFTKNGNILATKHSKFIASHYEIDKDHENFDHAYCLTSYGSQGKTVDKVMIVQPSATFPATNMKQFYVSISRAKESVTIYTDDKDALLSHAEKSGDRQYALEVKPLSDLEDPLDISLKKEAEKTPQKPQPEIDIDYDDKEPHV